jgi:pectinesterase
MKKNILLFIAFFFSYFSFAQNGFVTELTVAKDGTGNFKTIQEAINSVRDLGQETVTVFIKNGLYHEKLVIPSWKTNIRLKGESKESTIITNNDFSGKLFPGKDQSGKDKFGTFTSYTVLVQGNGFSAENLTIQNTAGRVGQAVALHVEADRVVIKNCNITGNQDTLYTATSTSRQYYQDCYIEGTSDFIFGEATVVFQNCVIKSLANSFITAASTTKKQKFGYVFLDCQLLADPAVDKVFLGRPWRPYAQTVFIRCRLGEHIAPQGWDAWKGDAMFRDKELTTFYAEYQNIGRGAHTAERVAWSHQLTKKVAKKYVIQNVLGGTDNWNPIKEGF